MLGELNVSDILDFGDILQSFNTETSSLMPTKAVIKPLIPLLTICFKHANSIQA
jgi:hypothetical protein